MTDFRERYKRLGFDPEANRALRSQRHDEARRGLRDEQMSLRREMATNHGDDDSLLDEDTSGSTQETAFSGLSEQYASSKGSESQQEAKRKAATAEHEQAVQQRWERLQKWREEKNKRKQIEKKKAKPVFKVGVVHHRVYSPPVSKEPAPLPPPKLCRSRDISANLSQPPPKRVTRATEKRLAIKTLVNQQKRENMRSKKAKAKVDHPTIEDNQIEIVPRDHIFKAPVGVTPMPIFGRHALEATKEKIQAELDTFQISSITSAPAFSESFNESSLSLKFSSDDQEMMDDSMTTKAKSPLSRRSSKNISPPAADVATVKGVTPSNQEITNAEHFIKTEERNSSFTVPQKTEPITKLKNDRKSKQDKGTPSRKRKSIAEEPKSIDIDSPRRTRSTRATAADERKSAKIASNESVDSGIESNSISNQPLINKRRSTKIISSGSVDSEKSETESKPTPNKKGKLSTSRRRASRIVSSDSIEKETVPTPEKPVTRRRSTKLISSGSTDMEVETFVKPATRRRSTKITSETENLNSSSVVTIADVHHSPRSNEEASALIKTPLRKKSTRFTTQDQENAESEVTNLMDFTFSAPTKPPKLADPPKTLLDDSVSNLSPRRSSRLPAPSAEQAGNTEEEKPLIRFSSFYNPTPTINESSSSEPLVQRSPNSLMNLSLDMSLPKETSEEQDVKPLVFFSPYIVQSRGKNSARKEIKKKRFSRAGSEDEDIPTKENIMQKLNISVEEEERTAQYYKLILDKEIERLTEICEHWNAIMEDPETPEEIRYIILAACGQTQLLIQKKFERFRGLVQDCETGRGEMLVTCKDLQGFWDMMYMEVNNCDSRFNKLAEMKANNWIEKEDNAVKEVEKTKKKFRAKKPVTKKPATGKSSSSLRAMIAAARKKKAGADGAVEGSEVATTEHTENLTESSSDNEKPMSPSKSKSRHTSTPKSTNKWDSFLKKVQLSQTRKATTSPLVMMKLSQMVKTPEVQLDDSIVYINSARTPAKSILKKDEVMGSVSKSTNKVFFKEQSNQVKVFDRRTNSLGEECVSLDDVEETKEPVERKLDFEDESFLDHAEEKDKPLEISVSDLHLSEVNVGSPKNKKVVSITVSPTISMSPLTLEDTSENSSGKKKPTKTKKQISFQDSADESQPRSLRAKKFSAPSTPIPKHRNKKHVDEDTIMEVDDSASEPNGSMQHLIKEMYLNEQGVICERFVSIQNDSPGTSRLKHDSSDIRQIGRKSKSSQRASELINIQVTPKPKRRNANGPEIQVTTPNATLHKLSSKRTSSTPRSKKQTSKRSFADTTLTEDNVDDSIEEATTPKLSKKTPKSSQTKSKSTVQSPTPTLKRTRSLKIAKKRDDSIKETESPKLRRTKSLTAKKVDAEDSLVETLKRKSMKKLQENIEPNQQETDNSTKEKLPKTPSSKRKSSKKSFETVENSEKLTDVSAAVSDMTPNTRRKSLRITRASTRDEN